MDPFAHGTLFSIAFFTLEERNLKKILCRDNTFKAPVHHSEKKKETGV